MTPRARRKPPEPRFDPKRIFHELNTHHVGYILIGGLARIIQGTSETTHGFDLVPRPTDASLRRLQAALEQLDTQRVDGEPLDLTTTDPDLEPLIELTSSAGRINVVHTPPGTHGYDDLRQQATREHLGNGIRAEIASPGDLTRMLETHAPPGHQPHLHELRHITEHERTHTRGIGR